jgi:DNA-directed RNA polymerase subunit RPC12/RpoP
MPASWAANVRPDAEPVRAPNVLRRRPAVRLCVASRAPVDQGRLLYAGGDVVPVVASYPQHHGFLLHSLEREATYRCAACGDTRTSVVVATTLTDDRLICPDCYSVLARGTS